MNVRSYMLIGIGVIIISMIFLILSSKNNKRNNDNKPYLLSLVALSLIILNWIIYIAAFYLTDFSNIIRFTPVWFIVAIIGFVAAYNEFRNNRIFSIVVSGLAIINSIVGMVLWGIGKM